MRFSYRGLVLSGRLLAVGGLLITAASMVQSERLPVRYYTADEGLPHNRVMRIVRDFQGFLWFCTPDGLSRFDGARFTTFRLEGELTATFNDLLETRSGEYWAATNGRGVCRLNYSARSPISEIKRDDVFTIYPVGDTMLTNSVNVLFEDDNRRIWAGTDAGLFVLDVQKGEQSFVPVSLSIASHPDRFVQVWAIAHDGEGGLWVGTKYGLARLTDGRVIHYRIRPQPDGGDVVRDLLRDEHGSLWIGHQAGLAIVKPFPAAAAGESQPLWQTLIQNRVASSSQGLEIELPEAAGQALWLLSTNVWCMRHASDGKIYIATRGEYLIEFDGRRFRTYSTAQGLMKEMRTIAEDADGNLWLGTQHAGAIRVARGGLIEYGEADGLKSNSIFNILKDRLGNLYFWGNGWWLHRLEGDRFAAGRFNLPAHIMDTIGHRDVITDHQGEWWVSTGEGLFRFPRVSRLEELATARPVAVYTTSDGLAGNDVRELFEDSRGDIWIGTFAPDREVATRWERATGTFHRYSDADGLPTLRRVVVFGEDASGGVWMSFWGGGLARYKSGRFALFTSVDGLPDHLSIHMYLDSTGRLWASHGGPGGLYRIDYVERERPSFVKYDRAGVHGPITEDSLGRLYFNTRRGLARFHPEEGQVTYTGADALASTEIFSAQRDRGGNLWFGAANGLSRLAPAADRQNPPPPVFISALRVGGVSQPISVFGQSEAPSLEIGPGQNQIQIEFFGLSFSGPLRYQYRVEGSDPDWSDPTDQGTFYANLRPGSYRFLVRAVRSDGTVSPQPASFAFVIIPPFWQRWWFITIASVLLAMAAYAIYRYRVSRLIELERVRTRIATDLHDDIGSSLSQVAVITEVLRRQIPSPDPRIAQNLTLIARVSREVVDSMSDIVWAINPQKDNLFDLARRMRRFAGETLAARDIEVRFHAPESEHSVKLGADVRRQVFLIFKESITNILRHAGCSEAAIDLTSDGSWLVLVVTDNGKGIRLDQTSDGHGLASMKVRAERLGGSLKIDSPAGLGTTITLRIPHSHRAWLR